MYIVFFCFSGKMRVTTHPTRHTEVMPRERDAPSLHTAGKRSHTANTQEGGAAAAQEHTDENPRKPKAARSTATNAARDPPHSTQQSTPLHSETPF